MDVEQIKALIELMEKNALTEVMIREGEFRLVLKRGHAGAVTLTSNPVVSAVATPPMSYAPVHAAPPVESHRPAEPPAGSKLTEIKAPMVGTFYASADPESQPFVRVGSPVDKDTVVCIIEAMKVFNEIKAECSGVIERVAAENGGPVEFGQALFLVRPSA